MALWTPEEITTALWLDAADSDTITLNNGNVSQWDDKSGNARHATQSSASVQPAYTAAGIGGLHVIDTVAAGYMSALFGSVLDLSTATVVAVFKANASSGTPQLFDLRRGSTDTPLLDDGSAGGFGARTRNDARTLRSAASHTRNTSPHLAVYRQTSTQIAVRLDGGVENTATRSGTVSLDRVGICSNGFDPGLNRFPGLLGEFLIFPSDLSDDEADTVEGYIAWKWGLEANLPSGHFYENAAPTIEFFGYFGTTRDKNGALAQRRVIASPDSTGECVANILSDPVTGEYEIAAAPDTPHTLIFTGEPDRNAQVFTGVLAAEKPE